MYISYYYFCHPVANHYSMVLWLRLTISKMVNHIVFPPLQGFDVCCFKGLVNFDESAVKSEKGVVNSVVFCTYWGKLIITQLVWLESCKSTVFLQQFVRPGLQNEVKMPLENSKILWSRA